MIDVVKSVHRIPTEMRMSSFGEERQDKLVDIGGIIVDSVEFNEVRGNMLTKIEDDFKVASDYIDENYQIVR